MSHDPNYQQQSNYQQPPHQPHGFYDVPPEVKKLNWGAFLWGPIWAIGNQVWIGLLTLIPYAGVIMSFVLLFKGSEWAWKAKRWDSIEHFQRVQKLWALWGLGVLAFFFLLGIIITLFIVFTAASLTEY